MSFVSGSSKAKRSGSTTPNLSKITIFFVVAEVADEQADPGPVYWQPRSFHATQEAGSNGGELSSFLEILNFWDID
jgi:hypothetical protein